MPPPQPHGLYSTTQAAHQHQFSNVKFPSSTTICSSKKVTTNIVNVDEMPVMKNRTERSDEGRNYAMPPFNQFFIMCGETRPQPCPVDCEDLFQVEKKFKKTYAGAKYVALLVRRVIVQKQKYDYAVSLKLQ